MNKVYTNGVHAVRDMDMLINDGEFLVFVGPSGCGKTTLLRMIAGLESVQSGVIRLDDRVINRVEPKKRDMAMVFQNYALYPTMSVADNIGFPLKMRRVKNVERVGRVSDVAARLGLTDLLKRRPAELSGGQRQRVALARAMIREPRLFLMDEPLSNLDAKLRVSTRREIVALQRDLGVTTVYVTHDQVEAMSMGDRIAVINDGELQQIGTPRELYDTPANLFTAAFIGSPQMNIWEAEVVSTNGRTCLTCGNARFEVHNIPQGLGKRAYVGIRAEDIHFFDNEHGHLHTRIGGIEFYGRENMVYLECEGLDGLTVMTGADFSGLVGEACCVRFDVNRLHFFDIETGQRV